LWLLWLLLLLLLLYKTVVRTSVDGLTNVSGRERRSAGRATSERYGPNATTAPLSTLVAAAAAAAMMASVARLRRRQ